MEKNLQWILGMLGISVVEIKQVLFIVMQLNNTDPQNNNIHVDFIVDTFVRTLVSLHCIIFTQCVKVALSFFQFLHK